MGTKILTKDVLTTIPAMVASGMRAEAIASQLGCKVGTLKVRCSQAKISLRTPGSRIRAPHAIPRGMKLAIETIVMLRDHAERRGVSAGSLASHLLDTIARDDLFEAVLDR